MGDDSAGVRRGLRTRLSRARNAMFYVVPPRWRGRVAAALPARLAPAPTQPDFFDSFYDSGDPFGFDVNPEEQLMFKKTLDVCGEGVFGRVLEIGCAVGSFTEMIAPRAIEVLAIDVSPAAIEQATRRLRGHSNVRLETRTLPGGFPDGPFDLVIASDVLYYLPVDAVLTCLGQIEAALASGGSLVAVHFVTRMGTMLDGDEVHDILTEHTTMSRTLGERTEFGPGRPYRIDRYQKA